MRRLFFTSCSVLLMCLFGCGDDGVSTDASTDTGTVTDSTTGSDTGTTPDTGTTSDTGTGSDGATDGGGIPVEECFPIALDDVPLAIPETFDDATPTWRRPFDDDPICPATDILPPDPIQPVPYVAYAFCNEDTVEHSVTIEMVADDDEGAATPLDDPFLVVYAGQGVPSDQRQCLAINDDIPDTIGVSDAEITDVVIAPGEAITVVGTAFQWTLSGPEGRGRHIVIVTTEP